MHHPNPHPAVRLDRVAKRYRTTDTYAVHDVTLDVAPGEFFSSSAPPAAGRPPSCA